MDLLVEQVKMLAGEIAFNTSTLKCLVKQSANDPESSKTQVQNLGNEIQEKRTIVKVGSNRLQVVIALREGELIYLDVSMPGQLEEVVNDICISPDGRMASCLEVVVTASLEVKALEGEGIVTMLKWTHPNAAFCVMGTQLYGIVCGKIGDNLIFSMMLRLSATVAGRLKRGRSNNPGPHQSSY